MPSLKFADSKTARAKRLDEQNGIRRTARQAQSNAKRGILEVENNPIEDSKDQAPAEISKEQKLRERLIKLKAYKEQKLAQDQKAKATKKQPFVVPCFTRPEVAKKDVNPPAKAAQPTVKATPAPSARVTRSQAKKGPEPAAKQWIVSSTKTTKAAPKKLTIPDQRAARTPSEEVKPIISSFAPPNFIFSAPKGKQRISLLFLTFTLFCFTEAKLVF